MKTAIAKLTFPLVLCAEISTWAQGSFQNLDFESAVIVPAGAPFVEFAPAFPGWTGYLGTNQQSVALFNSLAIGTAAIGLLGPGWSSGGIIAGSYTAVLQAGSDPRGTLLTPVDASISQAGLIPAGVQSNQFLSTGARNGFTVSLNGQQIPMAILGTQGRFNLYGGDVSQFAGLTEELRITALSAPSSPANLYLDSIQFSDMVVPEPGAAALLLFAVAGFALLLRRPTER